MSKTIFLLQFTPNIPYIHRTCQQLLSYSFLETIRDFPTKYFLVYNKRFYNTCKENKKSPGRLFLSGSIGYPAYNRVGVESFHFPYVSIDITYVHLLTI